MKFKEDEKRQREWEMNVYDIMARRAATTQMDCWTDIQLRWIEVQ